MGGIGANVPIDEWPVIGALCGSMSGIPKSLLTKDAVHAGFNLFGPTDRGFKLKKPWEAGTV